MNRRRSHARPLDQVVQYGQAASGNGVGALVSLVQGIFYLVTGVWPLVDIHSFEMVTGPKADRWLVKTAGVLITAVGTALTMAGACRSVTRELHLLAVGSALGLTGIDVVYVRNGQISKVYLLDAVAELALVAAWLFAWLRERDRR
jgi:hypothetical protein